MSNRTYGPTTTAAEIVNGLDLHGHRVIVTGASSGSASRRRARSAQPALS